jgi:hypothetical protein
MAKRPSLATRISGAIILPGMINGGLGFRFGGPVESDDVPKWGVVVYSALAAVFGLSYTGLVIWHSSKAGATDPVVTKERSSYGSTRSTNDHHYTGFSNDGHRLRGEGFTNAHIPTSSHVANGYNNTSSKEVPVYDGVIR